MARSKIGRQVIGDNKPMQNGFERIVDIEPVFDKRDPDPSRNYGICACRMRMVLKGPNGAVQFLLFTGWYLPQNVDETFANSLCKPIPADLGYHSYKPMYDEHEPIDEHCKYLNGQKCYYEGSGLAAEKVFDILLKEGSDGVWKYLEEYYEEIFGKSGRKNKAIKPTSKRFKGVEL